MVCQTGPFGTGLLRGDAGALALAPLATAGAALGRAVASAAATAGSGGPCGGAGTIGRFITSASRRRRQEACDSQQDFASMVLRGRKLSAWAFPWRRE
jgi:hypothetical protein